RRRIRLDCGRPGLRGGRLAFPASGTKPVRGLAGDGGYPGGAQGGQAVSVLGGTGSFPFRADLVRQQQAGGRVAAPRGGCAVEGRGPRLAAARERTGGGASLHLILEDARSSRTPSGRASLSGSDREADGSSGAAERGSPACARSSRRRNW